MSRLFDSLNSPELIKNKENKENLTRPANNNVQYKGRKPSILEKLLVAVIILVFLVVDFTIFRMLKTYAAETGRNAARLDIVERLVNDNLANVNRLLADVKRMSEELGAINLKIEASGVKIENALMELNKTQEMLSRNTAQFNSIAGKLKEFELDLKEIFTTVKGLYGSIERIEKDVEQGFDEVNKLNIERSLR